MKQNLIAIGLLITALTCWSVVATASPITNNVAMKGCLAINGYTPDQFDTFDWNKASACYSNWKSEKRKEELAELRDFLKHNPRYRFPGQSMNRCWGKPREMPFESATLQVYPLGWSASVSYKDKIPAGCYENAPWDNRDVNK